MRRLWRCLILLSPMVPGRAPAQTATRPQQDTLPNGLTVVLLEDHSAPLVTVSLWYQAGSALEQAGRTGMAHLFEHLMFQGSEHVPAGAHFTFVQGAGGELSANTTEERTAFSQTLPSNQLALGLWLEADRMRSLTVTEDRVQAQRSAVAEERRVRVDNQPYGGAFLDVFSLPFDSADCFPYSHSIMGVPEDLEAAPLEDIQAFHRRHYRPESATLVVVGDIDLAAARGLIEQYFGPIPRGDGPATPPACAVNYARGARTRERHDPLAQLPAVIVAYRVPPHADPDSRALQLLARILGPGESSRLHRALVATATPVAVQAAAGTESREGPGVFYTFAIARQGVAADTLAARVAAEVARVAAGDIRQAELDEARAAFRAHTVLNRQTTQQMADELQHFTRYHGAAAAIESDLAAYDRLTVQDLARAAATYLRPENSTTVHVAPGTGAGDHAHEEEE
jgi:predicted Zn-dependent peptidase